MGHGIEKDWITGSGLRAVVVVLSRSGRLSHRCGYVEVPKGHPLHGVDYADVDASCHGGLTYSGGDGYPADGDGWWLGFDCHHSGDGEIEPDPRFGGFYNGPARTLDYVVDECESLAAQIVASVRVPA